MWLEWLAANTTGGSRGHEPPGRLQGLEPLASADLPSGVVGHQRLEQQPLERLAQDPSHATARPWHVEPGAAADLAPPRARARGAFLQASGAASDALAQFVPRVAHLVGGTR